MAEIMAFVGRIGSGKDTCAQYLVDNYGFKKESFASSLKDAVSAIFGWDRRMLEGTSPESRIWREQVDDWWSKRLEIPNLTPRWVLQYLGTDLCRNHFHEDIWVASFENRIRKGGKFVISDCRFDNELSVIKKYGGKIVHIKRGEDPFWWGQAIKASKGDTESQKALISIGVHVTEWGWAGFDFDHVIENNGTFDDLYETIKNQVLPH